MKAKALQFGKAMSAALFVLLLVVVGTKNALAQNLVATLQHGDSISMYYGSNAFAQAHSAAQTGDIITLSSGTFNPTTITKAITLRGAGCCTDTVTGINPTIIGSTIKANVTDDEHSLTIEGIWLKDFWFVNINNPRFIKCNFSRIRSNYLYGSSQMQNAQFVDCMVFLDNDYSLQDNTTNTQFINCYINLRPYLCTAETNVSFINSIVQFTNSETIEVMAVNSIFYYSEYYTSDWSSYASSSLFQNCVSIKMDGLFANQTDTTNLAVGNYSDVFETYNGTYFSGNDPIWINERFVLNSDFASSFLGNDGTEVGIHGGQAPYNPRPNYMVLKQCNVATQSTVDGKLSVEIQVVSEGE